MGMCVALLIAAEFMPASLLTPIARDLGATVGMAGQAISISGLFAVTTSLFVATLAARFDRRHVLVGLNLYDRVNLIPFDKLTEFFQDALSPAAPTPRSPAPRARAGTSTGR